MPAFLIPILAWVAKNAFLSSVVALVGPLITGILKFGGGIFTALAEIVVALSKSPEGRVMLALMALGIGFLSMRYHYIAEGKLRAEASTVLLRQNCAGKAAITREGVRTTRRQTHVK